MFDQIKALRDLLPGMKDAKSFGLGLVIGLVGGGMAIWFLYATFLIPGKDSVIATKQAEIDRLQSSQPASTLAPNSSKKKGQELAKEVRIFALTWGGNLATMDEVFRYGTEYSERFHLRVDEFIADAKKDGLDIGPLMATLYQKPGPDSTIKEADEILKLSDQMAN